MLTSRIFMQRVFKEFVQGGSRVAVFEQASFEFIQGDSYAIVGSSGSGKSTCIHLLAGIEKPTEGFVFFDAQSLSLLSSKQQEQFFRYDIGTVFQQPGLFQELTVLENVMLKVLLYKKITNQDIQRAHDLLQEVGLADTASMFPATLSGGQQQRIALLRSIFIPPKFLLVDEPTGSLDPQTGHEVIDLLLHYQKKYTMGLLVSTHDYTIAQKMNHVVAVENKKLFLKEM